MPPFPPRTPPSREKQIADVERQVDNLQRLVAEHERQILVYEERLDAVEPNNDAQNLLVRSQIEFLVLSIRQQLYGLQQSLDMCESMLAQTRNAPPVDAEFMMPGPPMPRAINLGCDNCGSFYGGAFDDGIPFICGFRTPEDGRAAATKKGWRFSPDGMKAECPECVRLGQAIREHAEEVKKL
jgi:hypothetical protein